MASPYSSSNASGGAFSYSRESVYSVATEFAIDRLQPSIVSANAPPVPAIPAKYAQGRASSNSQRQAINAGPEPSNALRVAPSQPQAHAASDRQAKHDKARQALSAGMRPSDTFNTYVDGAVLVPDSKHIPFASNRPQSSNGGLLRRISNKVKNFVLRRGSKNTRPQIFGPVEDSSEHDQRRDSRQMNSYIPDAEVRALRRVQGRENLVQPTSMISDAEGEEGVMVGSPERRIRRVSSGETLFEDFINVQS